MDLPPDAIAPGIAALVLMGVMRALRQTPYYDGADVQWIDPVIRIKSFWLYAALMALCGLGLAACVFLFMSQVLRPS